MSFSRLIEQAQTIEPKPVCAVAHPCDEISLGCAVDAAKMGLFVPILIGPKARIEAVAADSLNRTAWQSPIPNERQLTYR